MKHFISYAKLGGGGVCVKLAENLVDQRKIRFIRSEAPQKILPCILFGRQLCVEG